MAFELSATISVQMKVNLGNYESAEAFMAVSQITEETRRDDIQALLDGPAKIAYDEMKIRLIERVREMRAEKGA